MLSPVIPVMILTIGLGYLLVVTPEDRDEGLSLSLSDNMVRFHEQHIRAVVNEIVPEMGAGLDGIAAVSIDQEIRGPFMDMGNWQGYAFTNGPDLIVMTYTEADEDTLYSRDRYVRAASIVNRDMKYSNRDIHAGQVSFDVTSGAMVIGGLAWEVSGISIDDGAVAVVSVYSDVAG